METLLDKIRKESPGRYLTPAEQHALAMDGPYFKVRIDAMRDAEKNEREIVETVVKAVLKKYDFATGRDGYGPEKCYRDVSEVYRWCVYCMLYDDIQMLEDKLLHWLRIILQSLSFPGGTKSIEATYGGLRRAVNKKLKAGSVELLDPYFAAVERTLPSQ